MEKHDAEASERPKHNADDMIRRGDAMGFARGTVAYASIAALPAVTPKVRPLKFEQVYAEFYAAETPFGAYEVFGDYWRSPFSKKTEQSADPVAAAQADFDARTVAALDLTPAPDAAAIRQAAEAIGQLGDDLCHIAEAAKLGLHERAYAISTTLKPKGGA